MPPVLHAVPFPCAVYVRPSAPSGHSVVGDQAFRFSHCCRSSVHKALPRTLRVRDLQELHHTRGSAGGGFQPAMRRECFLVLVSGDTAQCVTVANAKERRTHFLFRGSSYSRDIPHRTYTSEFHSNYIPVHVFSTLAMFTHGRLASVLDIECGLILLPPAIREREIPSIAAWMEHLITKAAHNSAWAVTESIATYDETTFAKRKKGDERLACTEGRDHTHTKRKRQ